VFYAHSSVVRNTSKLSETLSGPLPHG